jgi:hypothetical protein
MPKSRPAASIFFIPGRAARRESSYVLWHADSSVLRQCWSALCLTAFEPQIFTAKFYDPGALRSRHVWPLDLPNRGLCKPQ